MFRAILSAFLGYVVMVICVMTDIAILWFSLGGEFAFADESMTASVGWSMCMLTYGLIAAVTGGWVAAKVGGRKGGLAVRILICVIVIFGCMTILTQINAEPTPLPPGRSLADLTFLEAGQYAVSPMWYNVAIVIVGGVGSWLGGRFGLPAKPQNSSDQTTPPGEASTHEPSEP